MHRSEIQLVHPHRAEEASLHDLPISGSIYERDRVRPLRASQVWKPGFDLRAIQRLNPLQDREQIISFGKHQLLTEADEHAARSVISTHTGHIDGNTFIVNDFDMLKATENALRAQPDNPRIQAEFTGLRVAMENMRDGKAQVILSPAKEGMTYGLGFVFIPGESEDGRIPVTQKIILYDHEGGGMSASASIRDSLLKLGDGHDGQATPTAAEAYIAHPLTLDISQLPNDEGLVTLFGSDPAKIAFATQFRELLTQYAGAQMQEYGELLVRFSRTSGTNHEFERQASHIKDAVFAVGTKLAYAMRTNDWGEFRAIVKEMSVVKGRGGLLSSSQVIETLLMNAATVIGGTQCPPSVLERSTGMDILGVRHLDVMKNYATEWRPVTDCVKCPHCAFVSSPSKPHYKMGEKWSCGNSACEHHIHEKQKLIANSGIM